MATHSVLQFVAIEEMKKLLLTFLFFMIGFTGTVYSYENRDIGGIEAEKIIANGKILFSQSKMDSPYEVVEFIISYKKRIHVCLVGTYPNTIYVPRCYRFVEED